CGTQPQEGTTHTQGEKLPPGPKDLSQLPDSGPTSLDLKRYPATEYSGQSRSLNKNWRDQHSWLDYSVTQDAAFCFACRLFSHTHFSKTEKSFIHEGFRNWKKATTSLKSHDNSAGHKFAMQAWAEFKLQKTKCARIQHALDTNHAKTVEENRHYIRAVIDALLYTACQNEAQRGHREGSQSNNRGNFLELLDMIFRYDEIVKKKLSGPGNAKYMHHDIQNELLDIIAGMIRKNISKEIMKAEHFALMVDETKDVSKQEQLSIMVRYHHQQSLHEEFLDFTGAEGLDADSLLKKIMETLAKCGIVHNACIGQCYDGAAVMSGHNSGVLERFRKEVSQAVYVHCYAHRLNLVLVDCMHNVQAVAEFFETIQKLYKFFSTSVVHDEFLKVQKELEPVNQHIELKRLSDTRWTCQHAACLAVKRTLPAIVTTLKRFVEGDNVHRAIESKGLDQQFITSLVAIVKLLLMTKQLSDHLQSPDLQLASSEDLVQSVISGLSEMRTEAACKDLEESAEDICKKVGIQTETVHQGGQQTALRHLDEFIITSSTGQRNEPTPNARRHTFYSIIDRMINELNRRFSSNACSVLMGTAALNPKHSVFLDKQALLGMAANYGVAENDLAVEVQQLNRLTVRTKDKG
ncbi:zinc finger MYM-type protein 1-like, partial [Tachypleus tridentatus]|uniref:zinc finger MYM-type protein 1-like n=1 Tax=Tachypleus tridentatus TaxID=6853 RepID=UPI003FCF9961